MASVYQRLLAVVFIRFVLSEAQHQGSVTVGLWRQPALAGGMKGRSQVYTPSLYFGRLQVGTPSKEFTVAFDTGSGNIIIPSTRCTDGGCSGHRKYDQSLSNTSEKVGDAGPSKASVRPSTRLLGSSHQKAKHHATQFLAQSDDVEISFGEGLVSGSYMSDRICLGEGRGSLCFQAKFIAANFESQEPFSTVAYDGILGLALPQLAEGAAYSIVDRMVEARLLDDPIFSIFLGYDGEASEATFGDYQRGKMLSDVFWAPVSMPGYWQFEMDDVMVGANSLQLCKGKSKCQAMLDTGTTFITGPDEVVSAISSQVELKDDCSNIKTLPDIAFNVQGHVLNLQPVDYVLQAGSFCKMALMPLDIPPPRGPLTILGEPFLRRYYSIYDRQRMRVGLALAKHTVDPPAIKVKAHRPLFPNLSKLIQSWDHKRHLHHRRHGPLAKLQELLGSKVHP